MRILNFISIILLLIAISTGCNNDRLSGDIVNNSLTASGKIATDAPAITFDKTTHNFGQINVGEIVTYRFKFTNSGNSDLIITSVKASCGCTKPKWPTRPIAPGKSGEISISFNSKGRKGFQQKNIAIVTNAQPSITKLTIKANVVSAVI